MNERKNMSARNLITAFAIFAGAIGLDQLIKYFIKLYLKPIGQLTVIPGVVEFHYAENTGAAFSMFRGAHWLLISVAVIVVAAAAWYLIKHRKDIPLFLVIVAPLIAAGGVGNQIIDRIGHGYVVDYINFTFVDFAIFNFADICVVLGAIALLIYFIFFSTKKNPEAKVES